MAQAIADEKTARDKAQEMEKKLADTLSELRIATSKLDAMAVAKAYQSGVERLIHLCREQGDTIRMLQADLAIHVQEVLEEKRFVQAEREELRGQRAHAKLLEVSRDFCRRRLDAASNTREAQLGEREASALAHPQDFERRETEVAAGETRLESARDEITKKQLAQQELTGRLTERSLCLDSREALLVRTEPALKAERDSGQASIRTELKDVRSELNEYLVYQTDQTAGLVAALTDAKETRASTTNILRDVEALKADRDNGLANTARTELDDIRSELNEYLVSQKDQVTELTATLGEAEKTCDSAVKILRDAEARKQTVQAKEKQVAKDQKLLSNVEAREKQLSTKEDKLHLDRQTQSDYEIEWAAKSGGLDETSMCLKQWEERLAKREADIQKNVDEHNVAFIVEHTNCTTTTKLAE